MTHTLNKGVGYRLTRTMGQRLFVTPYSNTVNTNTTWAQLQAFETDFDEVRAVLENHTGSAVTIGGIIVAPTASPNDGFNPIDAASAAVSWTTIPNSSGLVVPAGSGSLPNAIPGRVATDWASVSSLARSDGGTLPLLMSRFYCSTAFSAVVATPSTRLTTDWPTIHGGRLLQCYYKSGNHVSSPSTFTTPTGPGQYISIVGWQFRSRKRGLVVMVGGDSLAQGISSTSGHNGFGLQLIKSISSAGRPASLINVGYSGQNSATFFQNIKNAITAYLPTVVFIPVGSPNDTQDQASADTAWTAAQDAYQHALNAGVIPILCTRIPNVSLNSTTDAYRKALNDTVRASGLRYVDFDAVITDGATPARINASYNPDGVHLNDTGYGVEATAASTALSAIPGLS